MVDAPLTRTKAIFTPRRGSSGYARRVWLAALIGVLTVTFGSVHAVGAAEADSADDADGVDVGLISEALDIIEERFVDEDVITDENLTSGAIRGMVEALGDDGHTVYLTPAELQIERDALDGRVSGIGVVVDQRAGTPLIVSVVDGSPADLAGVRAGDVIVTVDAIETSRLPLGSLAELIRGEADTEVRLGLDREGELALVELAIRRSDVEVQPASWAMVPGSDIAMVRIVQFSEQAGRVTRDAIAAAIESDASGLILDLRGNPGGLVDEALVVAGSFIEDGVGYLEEGRDGEAREVRISAGSAIAPDIPLMVLVDYGTASSAEILAAALRDNGRAVIVGETTYGTGTVLNTFRLSDGSALRIAVSSWLTPAGETVFRVGVAPDEEVALPRGAAALDPGDLVGMTALDFERSQDAPLQHAVDLLAR